jgi:hypothetical protein
MVGCKDNSLIKAIYQKSSKELQSCLGRFGSGICRADAALSLYKSADWPFGLRLLISHGFADRACHSGLPATALERAIVLGNLEAVELLVRNLAFLSDQTWAFALIRGEQEILEAVALALYRKFKIAFVQQSRHHICRPSQPQEAINYGGLYYELGMTVKAADALYKGGFRYLESTSSNYGSPLWYLASPNSDYPRWHAFGQGNFADARLLTWFLDRGAGIDSAHPVYKTMPLHLLAENFVLYFICSSDAYWIYKHRTGWNKYLSDEILKAPFTEIPLPRPEDIRCEHRLFKMVFESGITDNCTCRCTMHGCSAISSALKVARPCPNWDRTTVAHLQKRAIHEILTYFSSPQYHAQICNAALRSMTFHSLGLTHTCHNRGRLGYYMGRSPKCPLPEEDIIDIQYTEEKDISLLEELMVELEDAWNAWDGEFLSFIDGYWSGCIEKALSNEPTTYADEMKRLTGLGVSVKQYEPELLPVAGRQMPTRWELFQKQIQTIKAGDDLMGTP